MMKSFKSVLRYFDRGNVMVCGLRGTGKDLLFGNVIARRKKPYISNLNYGGDYKAFDYSAFDLGNDNFNFIEGNINFYEFKYPHSTDLYISDCGVYFPSQYQSELCKRYRSFPCYMALSRQVSHNNVHINSQSLARVWDKIREQSEIYIKCEKCLYVPKINLVFQTITVYEKYESALNSVKPCRVKMPLFCSPQTRTMYQMYIDNFENQHGKIKRFTVVYFNKSKHDTYYFEKLLKGGKKNVKKDINRS